MKFPSLSLVGRWRPMVWGLGCLTTLMVACSGAAGGPGDGNNGGDGAGGEPGSPPGDDTPVAPRGACKIADQALPEARAYGMSPRQYANTLAADFGYQLGAGKLPEEAGSGEGFAMFNTRADGRQVTTEHFEVFRVTAGEIAKALLSEIESGHACLLAAAEEACVQEFVVSYGQRAFRRPLDDEERSRFTSFFQTAKSKWEGKDAARMVIEAMLQSPRHLYLTELGNGEGDRIGLTHHEIANQLAYLLADGPPDEELRAAASDSALKDPAEVRRHGERLLATAAGRRKLNDFFSQLLRISDLGNGSVSKDASKFPQYSTALRDAMVRESETFVDQILFEQGGDLRTLYNADFSFVNKEVAGVYGLDAKTYGDDFRRVTVPGERKGILSQPAFLTLTTPPDHTSPAMRGITLFTKLLCRPIPNPPPGAADGAQGKIISPEANLTQREHWAFAQANAPECVSCHQHFVPMGLGLENFDPIGRHRPSEYGKTIDTRVSLEGYGTDVDGDYANSLDLAAKIVESQHGRECLAIQMQTYAAGRHVDEDGERCEIEDLAQRLKQHDYRVQDLVLDLTQLQSFYNRRPGS